MNSAQTVDNLIKQYAEQGLSKTEIVWKVAEACIGWPYVFGGYGQYDTPANRKSYANRSSCPAGESKEIIQKCQVLNGSKGDCPGCKFYPNARTRFFDCRGFTRWVLQQVGIILQGAGCTSQWNNNDNWEYKGEIQDLPNGVLACFFHQNPNDHKTMEHTGFILNGITVHCSGTVKEEKQSKKITHFAVPKGLGGDVPVPTPTRPTLRKGSKGEDVVYLQTTLIQLGYPLPKYGADGSFGNETLEAVKEFQRRNGLEPDGVVGRRTWEALESSTADLYTVTIQHLGKAVAEKIVETYGGTMTLEVKE